jgi:hypothetical protein
MALTPERHDYSSLSSHEPGPDLSATTLLRGKRKVTLEEAEQLCGFQLLAQAGNVTRILATMRELKKQQRQIATMQSELGTKKRSRPGTAVVSSRGSPQKSQGRVPIETERLRQQKRELLQRYEQKRAKHMKHERQREQFRTFLFSNMRIPSKKTSLAKSTSFGEVPPNLHHLYLDSVEAGNLP